MAPKRPRSLSPTTNTLESLPFSFPNTIRGFARSTGIARFAADALELEFESKDRLFGVIRSGVKELRISVNTVESVRLKKSMLKTELFIRLRSMRPRRQIPGHSEGEVRLRIARKHRKIATEMQSQIELRISELRMDRLEDEMKDLEA